MKNLCYLFLSGFLIFQSFASQEELEEAFQKIEKKTQEKLSTEHIEKYLEKLEHLQEELLEQKKELSLQEAQAFLAENAKNKEVHTVITDKLQYKIVQKGSGTSVQGYFHPILKYKAYHLNGTLVKDMEEEATFILEEAPLGLQKGIVGMKEGEKRILYIHPDLWEDSSSKDLLIYEVEIVQADTLYTEYPTKKDLAYFFYR